MYATAACLALLWVSTWGWVPCTSAASADLVPSGVSVVAERRLFTPTVRLAGEVRCPVTDDIMSHYRWWTNIKWLAPEGGWVDSGDPVGLVFNDGMEHWVSTDRFGVRDREFAALVQAAREPYNEAERQITLHGADCKLSAAEYELAKLERGPEAEEVRLAELAVERAELRLDAATKAVERSRSLSQDAGVSEERIEEILHERDMASSELARGRAALADLQAGASEMDLVTARAKVAVARAENESALRSAEVARKQDAAETASLTEAWHDIEQTASVRISMLKTMTRRATMPGVVYWRVRPGTPSLHPSLIATVIDPTEVVFTGFATDRQVARIEAGQECAVRLPALPESTVRGSVVAVSVTSDDLATKYGMGEQEEWERTRCSIYDVHIKLELGGQPELFQGMTGSADIAVGPGVEAVVLPRACCAEREDGLWALVLHGGEWRERRLTVAAFDEANVAVTEGVEDGETVAILVR